LLAANDTSNMQIAMTAAEIDHTHLDDRVDGLLLPQAMMDRPIA
jgi:hypothetical protein